MNRILIASFLAFVVASWAAVSGQQPAPGAGNSRTGTDVVSGFSQTDVSVRL